MRGCSSQTSPYNDMKYNFSAMLVSFSPYGHFLSMGCREKSNKLSTHNDMVVRRPANGHWHLKPPLTFPSPHSTPHTHRARPSATIATPGPLPSTGTGTVGTGIALLAAPIAPTLLMVRVPPRRRRSAGVSAQGTCHPRSARCLSVAARL